MNNVTVSSLVNRTTTAKFDANAGWPLEVQIGVSVASVLVFIIGQLALYVIDDPGLRREKAKRAGQLLDSESGAYSDDADSVDSKKKKKKRHGARLVSDAEQPKSGSLFKRSDVARPAELNEKTEAAKVGVATDDLFETQKDSNAVAVIAKNAITEPEEPAKADADKEGKSHEIAIQCTLIGEAQCTTSNDGKQLRRVVTDLQLEKPVTQANQTQVLLSAYLLKRPVAPTGSQQRVSAATESKRRLRAQSACESGPSEAAYHTWHIGDLPNHKRRSKPFGGHKVPADNSAKGSDTAKIAHVDSSTKVARVGSGTKLGRVESGAKVAQAEQAVKGGKEVKPVKKVDSRTSTGEKHVTLVVEAAEEEEAANQLKFTVGDTHDELAHEAVSNLSYVTVRGLNDVRRYQDARTNRQSTGKPTANGHELLDRNRNGNTKHRAESCSESEHC